MSSIPNALFIAFNGIKFPLPVAKMAFHVLIFLADHTDAGNPQPLVTPHLRCSGVCYLCTTLP